MNPAALLAQLDLDTGTIAGAASAHRHLSSLAGCFADSATYAAALAAGDPLIYSVASVEPAGGEGDLHYGLGTLQPGRVGAEYYMTKGHLHAWRPAAEVYVGLRGAGAMLLENERSGESTLVPLLPHGVVYVPGWVVHRTVNTGDAPLVYLGVYPARAGHDYGAIAERNFRHVVVEVGGRPALVERQAYVAALRPPEN